jgi:hypothetical protein
MQLATFGSSSMTPTSTASGPDARALPLRSRRPLPRATGLWRCCSSRHRLDGYGAPAYPRSAMYSSSR